MQISQKKQQPLQHEDSYESNSGLKSKIKKSKTSFPNVEDGFLPSSMEVSLPEDDLEKMVVILP